MWADIVEHHVDRARAYQCMGVLLQTAPTMETIQRLRMDVESRVEGCARLRALAELRRLLEEADAAGLASEYLEAVEGGPAAVGTLCRARDDASRHDAFRMAGIEPNGHADDELRVLALLSLGTARAMDAGDLALAVEHVEVQLRFLGGHGRACLADLAARLAASHTCFYSRVGRALGWQLEDDWAVLRTQEC